MDEHFQVTIDEDGLVVSPFLRTAFNYDMNAASRQTQLICEEETKAQQQFKEECDINTIIERFGLGGEIPVDLRIPLQGEFESVFDYQSALNHLIEADEAFMQLPASIRERFQNNAGKLLDFVSDPGNKDEAMKMGLLRPETPLPAPMDVRVVRDPSEPSKTPPEGSNP